MGTPLLRSALLLWLLVSSPAQAALIEIVFDPAAGESPQDIWPGSIPSVPSGYIGFISLAGHPSVIANDGSSSSDSTLFTIDLSDIPNVSDTPGIFIGGDSSWFLAEPGDLTIRTVPEPGTALLLASGIGVLAARRCRAQRAP